MYLKVYTVSEKWTWKCIVYRKSVSEKCIWKCLVSLKSLASTQCTANLKVYLLLKSLVLHNANSVSESVCYWNPWYYTMHTNLKVFVIWKSYSVLHNAHKCTWKCIVYLKSLVSDTMHTNLKVFVYLKSLVSTQCTQIWKCLLPKSPRYYTMHTSVSESVCYWNSWYLTSAQCIWKCLLLKVLGITQCTQSVWKCLLSEILVYYTMHKVYLKVFVLSSVSESL